MILDYPRDPVTLCRRSAHRDAATAVAAAATAKMESRARRPFQRVWNSPLFSFRFLLLRVVNLPTVPTAS